MHLHVLKLLSFILHIINAKKLKHFILSKYEIMITYKLKAHLSHTNKYLFFIKALKITKDAWRFMAELYQFTTRHFSRNQFKVMIIRLMSIKFLQALLKKDEHFLAIMKQQINTLIVWFTYMKALELIFCLFLGRNS